MANEDDIFSVARVNLDEYKLFFLADLTDELKRTNQVIRNDGVFVGIVQRDQPPTQLSELLQKLHATDKEERMGLAKKQIPILMPHAPHLFGGRSFEIGDGVGVCTESDVETFLNTAMNESSYVEPTCCTEKLHQEGGNMEVVGHFFNHVVPQLAHRAQNARHKVKPMHKVLGKGKTDAKSFKTFQQKLRTMTPGRRAQEVLLALKRDKRQDNEGCDCQECIIDDKNIRSKGVMYGSGVAVQSNDNFLITSNFGLRALGVTSLLRTLRTHYEGITLPYLYFGDTHSFFQAHYEDFSLLSVNFLHYGHPKLWIVVPPHAVSRLRECIQGSKSNLLHTTCPNVLGHKYFLPTPLWLRERKIPCKIVIQKPGEAVVLYPNAVHWGFNLGPNIAEASNFPSWTWVPYGIAYPKCGCLGGEAHLNIEPIVAATERPTWLQCLHDGTIPNDVTEEESPDFYATILSYEAPQQNTEPMANKASPSNADLHHETVTEMDESSTSEEEPFHEVKSTGKKVLMCPKVSCGKTYQGGMACRLRRHVEIAHGDSDDFQNLKDALDLMCPPKTKTPKRQCQLCQKFIAGRATNMKEHQKSKSCVKFEIPK